MGARGLTIIEELDLGVLRLESWSCKPSTSQVRLVRDVHMLGMHVWYILVYVCVGMESRTVLVVLDVGHARSQKWIACAQRVLSMLGTVWVAVDIGSVAKSGSP
jgi:hypothetical protein